ncbi:hypothetical protein [Geodermatophilus sp. URMC 63]
MAADDARVWTWVLGGLLVWTLIAVASGVVLGRGVRLADQRSAAAGVDRALTAALLRGTPAPGS